MLLVLIMSNQTLIDWGLNQLYFPPLNVKINYYFLLIRVESQLLYIVD